MFQLLLLLVVYPFWAATGVYGSKLIKGSAFERWFALAYITTWHLSHWVPQRGWATAVVGLVINILLAQFLIKRELAPIMLIGWGFTSMVAVIFKIDVLYWDLFIFGVYAARTVYAFRSKE